MSRPGGANNSNHDPGLHNSGAQQHVNVNAIDEQFRRLYRMHSLQSRIPGEYTSELTRSPRPKIFLQLPPRQEQQDTPRQVVETGGRGARRSANEDALRAAEGLARIRTSAPIEKPNGIQATSNDKTPGGGVINRGVVPLAPRPEPNTAIHTGGHRENQIVKTSAASGIQQGSSPGVVNRGPQTSYGNRVSGGQQDLNNLHSPTPGVASNGLQSLNHHQISNSGAASNGMPGYGRRIPAPNWSADKLGARPIPLQSTNHYPGPIPRQNGTQPTGDIHRPWNVEITRNVGPEGQTRYYFKPHYPKTVQPSTSSMPQQQLPLAPPVGATKQKQTLAPSDSTTMTQQQQQTLAPSARTTIPQRPLAPSVRTTTQQQPSTSAGSTATQQQRSTPSGSSATQQPPSKSSGSAVTRQQPSTPSGTTTTPTVQQKSQHPQSISIPHVSKPTAEARKTKEETSATIPHHEPVPGSIAAMIQFIKQQNSDQNRNQEPHNRNSSSGARTDHENVSPLNNSANQNVSSGITTEVVSNSVSEPAEKGDNTSSSKEQPGGMNKASATQGMSPSSVGREPIGSMAKNTSPGTAPSDGPPKLVASTQAKSHSQQNATAATSIPPVQGKTSQGAIANATKHRTESSSTVESVGLYQREIGGGSKPAGEFEGQQPINLPSSSADGSNVDQNKVTRQSTSAHPVPRLSDKGTPSSLPKKPVTNSKPLGSPGMVKSPKGTLDTRKSIEVTPKVTKPSPPSQNNSSKHIVKSAEHVKPVVVPVRTKTTEEPRSSVDESDPRIRYVKEVERQLLERQKMNKDRLSKNLINKPEGKPVMINSRTMQKGISAEDSLLNQVAARAAQAISSKAGQPSTNDGIDVSTGINQRKIDGVGIQSDTEGSKKGSDAKLNDQVQMQPSNRMPPTKPTSTTTTTSITKANGSPADKNLVGAVVKEGTKPPPSQKENVGTSTGSANEGQTKDSFLPSSTTHKTDVRSGNGSRTYLSSSSLRIRPEEMNKVEEGEDEESLFMTPPPDEVRSPEKFEAEVQQEQGMGANQNNTQDGVTEVQFKEISSDEDGGPMEPPERAPEPVNYEAMLNSLGPTLDDIDAKREDPADEVSNQPAAGEVQGTAAEVDAWNASNREENFYKDDEVDDWEPPELPDNDSDEDFVMEDSDDNDDRPLSQFIGPKNSEAYLQTVVRSQPLKEPAKDKGSSKKRKSETSLKEPIKDKGSSKKRKTETPQTTPANKKAKVTPKSAPARNKPTSTKKESATKKRSSSPPKKPSPKKPSPKKPSPKKQSATKDKDLANVKEHDDDGNNRSKRMSSEFRKLESSLVGKLFDLPSGGRRRSARY